MSATAEDNKKEETDGKKTLRERMEGRKEQGILAMASGKEMAKKYGPAFAGTYFVVYVGTLVLLFTGIEGGILEPSYVLSMVSENAE